MYIFFLSKFPTLYGPYLGLLIISFWLFPFYMYTNLIWACTAIKIQLFFFSSSTDD